MYRQTDGKVFASLFAACAFPSFFLSFSLFPFLSLFLSRPLSHVCSLNHTHTHIHTHIHTYIHRRALADKLPSLKSLQHLNLHHTSLVFQSDRVGGGGQHTQQDMSGGLQGSAEELAQAVGLCTCLKHLDLSGNHIGTRGVALLAQGLTRLHDLSVLSLRGAALDDTSASVLANLLHKCKLETLEVAHNEWSYFGRNGLVRASKITNVIFEADADWIREVAVRDWTVLRDCASDYAWTADKTLLLDVLKSSWQALEMASPALKNDAELFAACLLHHHDGWRALSLAGNDIRNSQERVSEACALDTRAIEFASETLKHDREFFLRVIVGDKEGIALKYAGSALCADKEVVLAAVQESGGALRFASQELRADRDVVMAAVRKSFHALSFAADHLKDDAKIKVHAQYWKNMGSAPLVSGPNWGNN